jgi:hypothetical protein
MITNRLEEEAARACSEWERGREGGEGKDLVLNLNTTKVKKGFKTTLQTPSTKKIV